MSKILIKIEPFGEFEFFKLGNVWLARTKNILHDLEIELSIENENLDVFSLDKTFIISDFLKEMASIEEKIYQYIFEKFQCEIPLETLKEMYFLSSLELKKDDKTWWIVYEPFYGVESIYNHFLRFTYINKIVVWSNLETVS